MDCRTSGFRSPADISGGHFAQMRIDQRHQLLEGGRLAVVPPTQKQRDLSLVRLQSHLRPCHQSSPHFNAQPIIFSLFRTTIARLLPARKNRRRFKEHAQVLTPPKPRLLVGFLHLGFGAASGGPCAFKYHAQNGSRPRRRRDACSFRSLAARDSALCASKKVESLLLRFTRYG